MIIPDEHSPQHIASVLHEALTETNVPCMSIDAIDGFLTAIICGPKLLNPSLWLPAIFLDAPYPEITEKQKAEVLLNAIFTRYNQIVAALKTNSYTPLLLGEVDLSVAICFWCKGFHKGMILFGETWISKQDVFLVRLCMPLLYFADPTIALPIVDPELLDAITNKEFDFVEDMISTIPRIRDFWLEERTA